MALSVLCTYSKMLYQEHFDVSDDFALAVDEHVVLSTRRGMEVGRVAALAGSVEMRRDEAVAGRVVRRAKQGDVEQASQVKVNYQAPQALKDGRKLVRESDLNMRLVDVEETLDNSKLIFYFTADGRVDFRQLVRHMASHFGKRIELRQIGARDVARLTGDVGSCGQELCCKTFLVDFVPVSMRMAKNQGTSLDKSKVSGMCGRLKCCMKYEDDLYSELRKTMPLLGQPVELGGREGWAFSIDILNQTVTVDLEGKREDFPVADIQFEKMSERRIRTWHKERRERVVREREERAAEKEARRERRHSGAHARTSQPNEALKTKEASRDGGRDRPRNPERKSEKKDGERKESSEGKRRRGRRRSGGGKAGGDAGIS